MFYGQYPKKLDDKDRVVVPAEFRHAVGEDEGFFLTITPSEDDSERCISVFPERKFNELFLDFATHDGYEDDDLRRYSRIVIGSSAKVHCDKQGRILIPKHLRDDAGVEKDVVLVGCSDRAEIWDRPTWERYQAANRAAISKTVRSVNRRRSGSSRDDAS